MDGGVVTFRATVNGLIINMKKDCEFQYIIENLKEKVESAGRFFRGASLAVKYKGRDLSIEEENIIHELLKDETGAEIKSFLKYVEEKKESESSLKIKDKLKMKESFFKGIDEGVTKYYKGTIRSGQLFEYDGNIVIIGDINPGGEIVATGNIIILGSLRGTVHAGSDGNANAFVIALCVKPVQLRIANIFTRSPDNESNIDDILPEIAVIRENTIYIENFLPQR